MFSSHRLRIPPNSSSSCLAVETRLQTRSGPYNCALTFTSTSSKLDKRVSEQSSMFQIQSALYHLHGPLCNADDEEPTFAQASNASLYS